MKNHSHLERLDIVPRRPKTVFKIASLFLIQASMYFGVFHVATAQSLPDFCYSQKWVVENKKPVLKRVQKSNSELTLPQRYACQYPEMGELSNAIYETTCRECNSYNGQSGMMADYRNLIHKVGLIGNHDSRREPTLSEERKYAAAGAIYCEGCNKSVGSGTLVEFSDVVITVAHNFFDKKCKPRNGNSRQWWKGYVFLIMEDGDYKDYEIDRGRVLTRCTKDNPTNDIAILKLKRKVKYKGRLVKPFKLTVFNKKAFNDIKRNKKTIMAAYGLESKKQNGKLVETDSDIYWFINKDVPLSYYWTQNGNPRVRHLGDTTGGASGGALFYKNGYNYDVYAIHKGGSTSYNVANGIRQEMIDIVHEYGRSF